MVLYAGLIENHDQTSLIGAHYDRKSRIRTQRKNLQARGGLSVKVQSVKEAARNEARRKFVGSSGKSGSSWSPRLEEAAVIRREAGEKE